MNPEFPQHDPHSYHHHGRLSTCGVYNMQCVRDKYAALFAHGACTMQQLMWQVEITGVAHSIKICFAVLDAPV